MKRLQTWVLQGVCLFSFALSIIGLADASPPSGKGYTLVFGDEFNGTRLDATKWSYNYPWGTHHNGQANMQPSQVTIGNGLLTLKAEARRSIWEPWGVWNDGFKKYLSFDYTSGAIHTNGKRSFKYGYMEGRFKMPSQASTWPAFWMLQNGWPPELDILEVQGDRRRYYYNYHHGPDYQRHQSFGGEYWNSDALSNGWHTYGVEWTPTSLHFYFDDRPIRSFTGQSTAIQQMNLMYLLVNLQVGGWAPNPTPSEYPALYQCDWVRVWQTNAGPASGVYRLTPRHAPDKAMEVNAWNISNGAKIDIYSYGAGANSQFRIERQGDGTYKIRTNIGWTTRVLDLNGSITTNGGKVTLWDDNGAANQRWHFEPVAGGWYRIIPKIDLRKCLQASGGYTANGTAVQTWDYTGANHQLWRLDSP